MKQQEIQQRLKNLMAEAKKPMMTFPWESPEFYANWVAQTYYYARHTTRLLALAGAYCSFEDNEFHVRFLDHCKEEKGHEKLLVKDLQHFGYKPSDFEEGTATSALYQTQYYFIQNKSPLIFFGYVLALEALAADFGDELTAKIEKAHGKTAAFFMRVHAHEDIDHVEKAIEKMSQLPPEVRDMALTNMVQTIENYTAMLKECARANKVKVKKAA